MIPDYYKRLGLLPDAKKEDLKKAYRRLALQYHPDKNKSSDAHETFIAINEAYLILYDDEARAKYDREYNYFFKQKERWAQTSYSAHQQKEQEDKQSYTQQKPKYSETEQKFDDENLNKWAKSAREQAESFAKLTFDAFAKLIVGVAKETGFQISNVVIGIVGGLFFIAGVNDTFVFLFTGMQKGNPLVIILAVVGFFIIRFAYQREQKHKTK